MLGTEGEPGILMRRGNSGTGQVTGQMLLEITWRRLTIRGRGLLLFEQSKCPAQSRYKRGAQHNNFTNGLSR